MKTQGHHRGDFKTEKVIDALGVMQKGLIWWGDGTRSASASSTAAVGAERERAHKGLLFSVHRLATPLNEPRATHRRRTGYQSSKAGAFQTPEPQQLAATSFFSLLISIPPNNSKKKGVFKNLIK